MTGILKTLGYESRRHRAVLGSQITFSPPHGKGGYACLMSHIKVQLDLMRSSGWALIAEDDVVIYGMIDLPKLIESAPEDATLLQLATLSTGHFGKDKPLWSRSTNGYYGTQLYAVNCDNLKERFDAIGVTPNNFQVFLGEPLPSVPKAQLVADSYIFCMHTSYVCKYPFAVSDIALGSLLHPDHLSMHKRGWMEASKANTKERNPFLIVDNSRSQ